MKTSMETQILLHCASHLAGKPTIYNANYFYFYLIIYVLANDFVTLSICIPSYKIKSNCFISSSNPNTNQVATGPKGTKYICARVAPWAGPSFG